MEARKHTPKRKFKERKGWPGAMINEVEPIELKPPKFKRDWNQWLFDTVFGLIRKPPWKRDGFKRVTGIMVGLTGIVLKFFPEYEAIGEIIIYIGGALGIGGSAHGMVKNRQKDGVTKIDKIAILRWIADLLIKYLTRKKEKTK